MRPHLCTSRKSVANKRCKQSHRHSGNDPDLLIRSNSSTVADVTESTEAEASGLCVQLRLKILYCVKVLFKNEVRFLFLENKN